MTRVLIVEDDPTVAEVVGRYLVRDGFEVEIVDDGRVALDAAKARPPDLVVLDIMLPGLDGVEVCRALRAYSAVPIVMLTALGAEADRILGLEVGADDYVTKPFSPRELVLRIRSVLRRASAQPAVPQPTGPQPTRPQPAGDADRLIDGDLTVDPTAHEVRLAGAPLALTAREYDLLVFLLRHPRQAFRREDLLSQVWGWSFGDLATVTVHIRRLREKVERNSAMPVRLVTVWGVGYRYEPTEEPA